MLQKIFIKEHEALILSNGFTIEEFEDLPGNKQTQYIEYWKEQDKKKRRSEVYQNYEEASLKMLGNYLQETERQKALKEFKNQLAKEAEDKKQGQIGEGKELIQRTRLEWNREKIMYFFKEEQPKPEQEGAEPVQRSIFDLRNAKKRVSKKEQLKALEEKQRMYSERFNKRTVFDFDEDKRISPEVIKGMLAGDKQKNISNPVPKPSLDEDLMYGRYSDSDDNSVAKYSRYSSQDEEQEQDSPKDSPIKGELDDFEKMLAQGLSEIGTHVGKPGVSGRLKQSIPEEPKPVKPENVVNSPAAKKNIPRQAPAKRVQKKVKPTFQELGDEEQGSEKQSEWSEGLDTKSRQAVEIEGFKRTRDDIQAQMHKLKTLFDEEEEDELVLTSSQKKIDASNSGMFSQRPSTLMEAAELDKNAQKGDQQNEEEPSDVADWLRQEETYLDQIKQHRTLKIRQEDESQDVASPPTSPRGSQPGESGIEAFFGGFNRDFDENSNSQQKFRPEYELKTGIGSRMQQLQSEFMDKKVPSITDISSDPLESLKQLLDLFGIPFVDSPGEAEAQCAKLEIEGKVDGIITEDSDAFLFGSKRVIRGLFGSGNNPEEYCLDQIELELGFSREQLIMLALFLGCDYTIGIHGVGIVNAVEIVDAYGTLEALSRFKKWAEKPDYWMDKSIYEESRRAFPQEYQYMLKHRNYKKEWTLPNDFPSTKVVDAFMNSEVSASHPIDYKLFEVDKIIDFATRAFQFNGEGFNMWKDALRQEHQRRSRPQQSIEDFFKPVHFKYKIKSTRLKTSLENLKINKINEGLADIEQSMLTNSSIQAERAATLPKPIKQGTKLPPRKTFDTDSDTNQSEEQPVIKKKPKHS